MRRIVLLLVTVALLSLGGCASSAGFPPFGEGFESLPTYSVEVLPNNRPSVTDDGYELTLGFEVEADGMLPFRHIVQEIRQSTSYTLRDGTVAGNSVTLVECFRLREVARRDGKHRYRLEPFQRDRHFDSGYRAAGASVREVRVERDVRMYLGLVEHASFTFQGFAHLPQNRDGSVVTRIPSNFNRSYQDNHTTRGRIVHDDRENGSLDYRIVYDWRQPDQAQAPVAELRVMLPPGREPEPRELVLRAGEPAGAGAGE